MSADRAMRGVFLDLDGTLADSIAVMKTAYYRFLDEFRIAGDEQEFDRLNGPPLRDIVETLSETHGLAGEPAALHRRYLEIIETVYPTAEPAAGAALLLQTAVERGYVVTVVTSSSRELVETWLERAGLRSLVTHIVCGSDVERGKPDPEPYLAAMRLAAVPAAQSIAVEDSAQGLRAALGAGLPTYSIGPHPPSGALPGAYLGHLDGLAQLADRL